MQSRALVEAYFLQLTDIQLRNLARHYLYTEDKILPNQEIARKLIAWLLDEQHQRQLVALLDDQDRFVLQALETLHQLPLEYQQNQHLLKALLYPLKRQTIAFALQNLRERLWIIDPEYCTYPLINPLLKPIILPDLEQSTLFTTLPHQEENLTPQFTPALIHAILTIYNQPDKEKITEELQAHFSSSLQRPLIDLLLQLCYTTNLINPDHSLNLPKLIAISHLDLLQQTALFYAHLLYDYAPELDRLALQRLLLLLFQEKNLLHHESFIRLYAMHLEYFKVKEMQALIPALEHFFLIRKSETHPHYYQSLNLNNSYTPIRIEGNLTFFYSFEQPLQWQLILTSTLIHYDIFSTYALDKDRFIQANQQQHDPQALFNFFADATQTPENFKQTLHFWLEESTSLQLYHGYLLQLHKSLSHLLQNQLFLQRFVNKVISEEFILLKDAPCKEFYHFIHTLGLPKPTLIQGETHPHIIQTPAPAEQSILPTHLLKSLISHTSDLPQRVEPISKSKNKKDSINIPVHHADNPIQQLYIERKLIISAEQLMRLSTFRQQASGIDYHAKVRLVELAIKEERDLLLQINNNGEIVEHYLMPLHFDKKATQQIKAYDYRHKAKIIFHINAITHLDVVERSLLTTK